ncbi:MAG: cytochrome P450 [Deltaproteobacteria bacterium]|nr:cytochrome P450 [Deltaproteobacteria bacterium]
MSSTLPSLVDPQFVADPFAQLAWLREHDPVHWDEALGTWFITRYEDVRRFFSDPRLSTDRRLARSYRPAPPESWLFHFEQSSIISADPEGHRRWRHRLSAGFTPRAVRRMDQQVRDIVEEFAAPLRGQTGEVDLLAAFTDPIPNTVIGRITGIPPYPGDEARFRSLAQQMMQRFTFFADAAKIERGNAAIEELAEWVMKLADERRQTRADDLLSDLIHGNAGDEALTNREIVVLVAGLVAAGSETTTLGGTQVIRHLLKHPGELARVRADRSLVRNAVREALRFDFGSLAAVNMRFATEPIELAGQTIRPGDMLMLSPASANRDPSVFPDPDRFDVGRDTRDVVSFGHGPRYCLGANLAMQEMACMLEAALDFLPEDARLVEHEADWEQIGIMRRPLRLVVDFGPERRCG